MTRKQKFVTGLFVLVILAGATLFVRPSLVFSHCQIPCGIYDDEARFKAIAEHITTIEKSMKRITELSKESPRNFNQIVRWVNNKEHHADELTHIVTYYFLAQRVKPTAKSETKSYGDYVSKLTALHQLAVYAMKAKQTTDLGTVERLRSSLAAFRMVYAHSH